MSEHEKLPEELEEKKYYLVDAKAMEHLLRVLQGPPHFVRELQVTRRLPGRDTPNPIDVLLEEVRMQHALPPALTREDVSTQKGFNVHAAAAWYRSGMNVVSGAMQRLEKLYGGDKVWRDPAAEELEDQSFDHLEALNRLDS